MKITITGSLGNISKPLAKLLINAGHKITIISSNADKTTDIEALGATAAIGLVTDVAFLNKAFTDADAVYTMVPPNFGASNFREYVGSIGKNYAEAIEKAGVRRVVNLSSIGAHLASGTGPITGSHDVETALNKLTNVAVKHLRAPFFYFNFFGNIEMIKNAGIMGSNYPGSARLVMVHPEEIAVVAAEELQQQFTGKSVRYLVSDDRTIGQVATILGTAIGKPELPWIEFTDEQTLDALLQDGLPPEMVRNFVEMGTAIRSGVLWGDYDQNKPAIPGKIKLEEFAKTFADRFNHA
ncbi:NAD(P)H-binding protein [Mucilaginibacter sabulilitoris]|uniref:NAD(P)H-binding protein n=1 Tax=Mucilaginibacter sabulilitoris TaxID=1173583 RepID=A0ABZ0TTB3_9SPHI|nr:NAD(P)H-binding protein [Mucilaginibacter sabulilitoris]WPU96006.1 NAD(P)H-binding protein [Mucilaginibacter sabulilitoris]